MGRPDLRAERERLLGFARGARVPGGFAWLGDDGQPEPRPPELWITARMTHVFALGELLGEPDCAAFADHGLEAIATAFADPEHGGWHAQAGGSGKAAYDHAFVLLAGASAALAGRPGGAPLLDAAAAVIDARFWAEDEGACRESWDDAWQVSEPYRGANANMHMVEAFLAAGDATGEPRWAARALRIAGRLIDREARAHAWRVAEHFSAGWEPLPDFNADRVDDRFRPFGHTPGHALEWARLLLGLRAALDEPPDWLLEAAPALFDRAVADGWGRRLRLHDRRRRPAGRARADALGARGGDRRRRDPARRDRRGALPRRRGHVLGVRRGPPDRSRARGLAPRARRGEPPGGHHLAGPPGYLPRVPGRADPGAARRAEPRGRARGGVARW